jgi:dTDP-4-dehydrorhamnose reductase
MVAYRMVRPLSYRESTLKLLVIGSSGLLGSKLLDKLAAQYEAVGTFYSTSLKAATYKNVFHLDATRHKITEKVILDLNPDIVIYAASISRPDVCEVEKELAFEVNFKGLQNVASVCASLGKKIVYISTDHVFPGDLDRSYSEQDTPQPVNHYGQTKLLAEEFLRAQIPDHLIIRSTMMYGFALYTVGRGLVNAVLESLARGEKILLDNQRPQFPVLVDDVCDAINLLIQRDERGTFHVSQSEAYTKYTFGCLVAETFGYKTDLLVPVIERNEDLPAPRASRLLLNTEKIGRLGFKATSPKDGIQIHRKQSGCLFRLIYSVRPDMLVAEQNASEFRINAGRALIQESPLPNDIDCIIPIPESGIYSATGVAAESGRPLFFGIIRDYFTEKTLYSLTQESRHKALKRKLIPVESVVKGKKIVLVDEAVISGSTLQVVIQSLKNVGVKEIHVRIPSPIMATRCTGRILNKFDLSFARHFPDGDASKEDFERTLAEELGVHSIKFLSLKAFLDLTPSKSRFCRDCFLDESVLPGSTLKGSAIPVKSTADLQSST